MRSAIFKKSALVLAVAATMGSTAFADVYTPTGTVLNSNTVSGTSVIGGGSVSSTTTGSSAPSPAGSAQTTLGISATTGIVLAGGNTVAVNASQALTINPNNATFDANGLTLNAGSKTDATTSTGVITAMYIDSANAANNHPVYLQPVLVANPAYDNTLPVSASNLPLISKADANGNPMVVGANYDSSGNPVSALQGTGVVQYATANTVPADVNVVSNNQSNTGGADLTVGGNATVAGNLTVNGALNASSISDASFGTLNANSHLNGISTTATSTTIAGGTSTTTLLLNDAGAHLSSTTGGVLDVQTGTNFNGNTLSNIGAGVAATDAVNKNQLDAEATARANADTAEATARAAQDVVLQNNINSEATTRANADTAEANARAAQDVVLQNNINAEATARANADATEATTRANADATLTANLAAESTRAQNAEAAIVSHVKHVEEDLSAGISSAVAMSNIPQVGEGQTMSVGVGLGNYNSESSLAVGGSYRINTNTVMKGSVATGFSGNGSTAVGLGVGYAW